MLSPNDSENTPQNTFQLLQEISLQLKQIHSSVQRNDGLFLEHLEELEEFIERNLESLPDCGPSASKNDETF